jgi:hypothetical protein
VSLLFDGHTIYKIAVGVFGQKSTEQSKEFQEVAPPNQSEKLEEIKLILSLLRRPRRTNDATSDHPSQYQWLSTKKLNSFYLENV